MNIVFLCTGNTCRSPMAEAIFNAKAKAAGIHPEVSAQSAGLHALEGDPAYPQAVKVMGWRDLDLSGHRSRRANAGLVEGADLVLTMTRDHAEQARDWFPGQAHKIFVFGELAKALDELAEESESEGGTALDAGDAPRLIAAVARRLEGGDESTTYDISDPFGRSEEMYDRVADMMEVFADKLIRMLAVTEKGSA